MSITPFPPPNMLAPTRPNNSRGCVKTIVELREELAEWKDNVGLGENDSGWGLVITDAISNITLAVTTLYTNGAREVIIGDLPNVGQTPAFNAAPAGFANYVDSKVALFNAMLQSAMTNAMKQNPGLRIYFVNLNAVLSNVLSAPAVRPKATTWTRSSPPNSSRCGNNLPSRPAEDAALDARRYQADARKHPRAS